MALRKETRSARVETFVTTAGNRFTKYVARNGRVQYRKGGRFTSSRAFHAAQPHGVATTKETAKTLGITRTSRIPRMEDVARTTKDGTWVAGKDAKRFIPWLKSGDKLTPAQLTELRSMQRGRLYFVQFLLQRSNRELSREEALEKYFKFLKAIQKAKTAEERREVLAAFGWDPY